MVGPSIIPVKPTELARCPGARLRFSGENSGGLYRLQRDGLTLELGSTEKLENGVTGHLLLPA